MKAIFNFFLIAHIVAGSLGLISGTINIIGKKGGKRHKLVGNLFFYSMVVTGCSSILLATLHINAFLLIVGVWTLYLTLTGKRYLAFKLKEHKPQLVDWIISFGLLLTSLAFISWGILLLKNNMAGVVLIVFGLLALRFCYTDYKNYRGNTHYENYWLIGHFQRMTGSYIAALTAFLVVNYQYFPLIFSGFIIWLFPTLIFVPFIVVWTRKYKRKITNK